MGFEPTTSYLGSKHSTTELHPQLGILSNRREANVKGKPPYPGRGQAPTLLMARDRIKGGPHHHSPYLARDV